MLEFTTYGLEKVESSAVILGRMRLPTGPVVPHVESADVPILEIAVGSGAPSRRATLDVGAGSPRIEPQTNRPPSVVLKQFLREKKGKDKRINVMKETYLAVALVVALVASTVGVARAAPSATATSVRPSAASLVVVLAGRITTSLRLAPETTSKVRSVNQSSAGYGGGDDQGQRLGGGLIIPERDGSVPGSISPVLNVPSEKSVKNFDGKFRSVGDDQVSCTRIH